MTIRLPSRYEDLDVAFRGHLRPNQDLLRQVLKAFKAMEVSGGIRFLPIYGKSGSGKSCAVFELDTHLPQVKVFKLSRDAIESREHLVDEVRAQALQFSGSPLIAIIDQFEEVAAQQSRIPKEFVESLALLDRGEERFNSVLFIWLTTDRSFQTDLVNATTRNKRILAAPSFEIEGPALKEWPAIIEETFSFHNKGQVLADYQLLEPELIAIGKKAKTLGEAIEETGTHLVGGEPALQDISKYQVVMLWPVTNSTRISRIQQFTDSRQGYKLNWSAWYQSLNGDEQRSSELRELNRARLYFDVRLVPIAAADLQGIFRPKDREVIPRAGLDRFGKTRFYSIVAGTWNPDNYAPLREREVPARRRGPPVVQVGHERADAHRKVDRQGANAAGHELTLRAQAQEPTRQPSGRRPHRARQRASVRGHRGAQGICSRVYPAVEHLGGGQGHLAQARPIRRLHKALTASPDLPIPSISTLFAVARTRS